MSNRGKILLIDDEPLLSESIELFLGDEFDLIYAPDGEAGLQMTNHLRPDLILLDVGMPGIDGLEVCRRLKADRELQHIPVIFLTAYGSVVDEMEGLRAGAVDYISKPFNEQIVKARVSAQFALKQQSDELRMLVRLDDLTQISNRRHFDEVFRVEWRRAFRYQAPLSIFLIDIDAFKKYNDAYGHVAGDECLREVAQKLKNTVSRSGDLMARFGGEEFIGLLPNTPETALMAVGDRLRTAIEQAHIPHEYSPVASSVTVSIGAASIVPAADYEMKDLVLRADTALYKAKGSGGNRVSVDQLLVEDDQALAS